MARCLVTGGAGFMGAHVVRALLDRGHDVWALDDLSGGFAENVDPRAAFVEASVTDHDAIDRLFANERFDVVFHLAAYAAEGLSHFIKRFNYTNNVIGSVNLINAAVNHGSECFVFTSSIAVYGAGQLPMTEDTIPEPEDSYGIAKRAVELELEESHRMFGLDYVTFRPHNVYGELQNIGDRYRNVLGIFMNQIMSGEPLSIFGDGEQSRAFSYVTDVVNPIADAPWTDGARGEIFNVGADQPHTVNTLAGVVREAMGAPDHPVVHHPARNEVVHAFSDHSKLHRVFGESEPTSLEEGVDPDGAVGAGARPEGDAHLRRDRDREEPALVLGAGPRLGRRGLARLRRDGCLRCRRAGGEPGQAQDQVQEVVLGVDRNHVEERAEAVLDLEKPPDRDQDVREPDDEGVGPRRVAGSRQTHQAGRDVNEVVPAVDVEHPEHRVGAQVVARSEAGLVEEADDSGDDQGAADERRVQPCWTGTGHDDSFLDGSVGALS